MAKFLFTKGHIVSRETRRRISESLKGRTLTEERKKTISGTLKRKKIRPQDSPNWKPSFGRQGKKLTEKQKKKIGDAQRGKPRLDKRGSNSHFWRGGVNPINNTIRHSMEYRLWRTAVFERDNYTCVFCTQKGGKLQADHIKPFSLFPELRFAIDNGRTLCVSCHKTTETYGVRRQN